MLLGMAPVLLMDSVGFFGWAAMFVSFIGASGDETAAVLVSTSSFEASLPTPVPLLALSPAELSVLDAMLAALGCDRSLAGPLLMVGSVESDGSGMAGGFFRMLPSTVVDGLVPETGRPDSKPYRARDTTFYSNYPHCLFYELMWKRKVFERGRWIDGPTVQPHRLGMAFLPRNSGA